MKTEITSTRFYFGFINAMLGLQCITFVSMVNYKSLPLLIEITYKLNTAIVKYVMCSQSRKLFNEQSQKHQSTHIKNILAIYE